MAPIGSTLPRTFRKLVIGITLPGSAPACAEPEDDGKLGEADRAIGVVMDAMVDRALALGDGFGDVLAILLQNMHPLDATIAICEAALSPHSELRRVLCDALVYDRGMHGRSS